MKSAVAERPSLVTGRLLFGLLVFTLGVLFMLDNFNVLDSDDVIRWWPVLPLAYGLMCLTGFLTVRRRGLGLVFTFGGLWLLLSNALLFDPWEAWPALLILLGVCLVVGSLTRRQKSNASAASPADTVSMFALWSGMTRKVTGEFRGGEVTAIMGGHELDLRAALMPEGSAAIDLFVWWGGVDLRVPADWKVTCEGLVIMGGIEDTTTAPSTEPRGHLILKGLVVMGGVEVKN